MLKFVPKIVDDFAATIRLATNYQLSGSGRSLLVEPLENHQRKSWKQGHRVRQHRTNGLVPHYALDEVRKSAQLGSAIPWPVAFSAVPTDHILLVLTRIPSDSAPQTKDGCIAQFR